MKNFLVIELSNLGSAYSIVNQFAEIDSVDVFEISPIGAGSILILSSSDALSAEILYNNIKTNYKNSILNIQLILEIQTEVILTYLSQNKPNLKKHLAVIEAGSVANMFMYANKLLDKKIELIDFRLIRTRPANVILTVTTDNIETLSQLNFTDAHVTIINDLQPVTKSYFEIVKN